MKVIKIVIVIIIFYSTIYAKINSNIVKSFDSKLNNEINELLKKIKKKPNRHLYYEILTEKLIKCCSETTFNKRISLYFKKESFQYKYVKCIYYRSIGDFEGANELAKSITHIPCSTLIINYLLTINAKNIDNYLDNIDSCNYYVKDVEKLFKMILANNNRVREMTETIKKIKANKLYKMNYDDIIFVNYNLFNFLNQKGIGADEILRICFNNKLIKKVLEDSEEYKVLIYYLLSTICNEKNGCKNNHHIDFAEDGLQFAKRFDLRRYIVRFNAGLARTMARKGDFHNAIEILKNVADYYRKRKLMYKYSYSLFEIGKIYSNNNLSYKALDYSIKSLKFLEKYNSSYSPFVMSWISNIYLEIGEIESAKSYIFKSRELLKNVDNVYYKTYSKYVYVKYLYKTGNTERALALGCEMYNDSLKNNNKYGQNIITLLLAKINFDLGNYNKSMFFAKLDLNNNSSSKLGQILAYYQIYSILEKDNCNPYLPQIYTPFLKKKIADECEQLVESMDYKKFKSLKEKYEVLENKDRVRSLVKKSDKEYYHMLIYYIILPVFSLILFLFALYFLISYYKKRNQNIIGAYRIKEKVGKGGMGTVYKAISIEDKKSVALKVMNEELVTSENKIQRFRREGEILKGLKHQNILEFYDIGEYKGKVYFASEFINGKNLNEIVKEKWPLPIEQSLYICKEIVKGLIYIHGNRIIHRDIKLSNIMCSENTKLSTITQINASEKQVVKIMDFGLAKDLDMTKMTKADTIMGTPAYLAPETILMGISNESTDIYSFGVLMYELFAGVIPFQHPEPASIMYQIINTIPKQPIEVFENIPEEINNMIMKCIEKKPENRYGSAKELLEKLNKY